MSELLFSSISIRYNIYDVSNNSINIFLVCDPSSVSDILYNNIFDIMEIMDAGISESYIFINTAHYIPELSGENREIFLQFMTTFIMFTLLMKTKRNLKI